MDRITRLPPLPPRPTDGHKGTFGKVLVVAGSKGMTGAAFLAGRATLRAGAGLVRVAVPDSVVPIVASLEPCYTTIPLPEDHQGRISLKAVNSLLNTLSDNDCVALGPGIGQSRALCNLIRHLLAQPDLRLILDADGLNNLSRIPDWIQRNKTYLILTPHPGEMKRLWAGQSRLPVPLERESLAKTFAQETGSTVVLKGAGTVVCNGKKMYVNNTGNPGMATAGSGDVLTGIIAALLGQGMVPMDACITGVYVHGLAGDLAAAKNGLISLIATDLLDALPQAFQQYPYPA